MLDFFLLPFDPPLRPAHFLLCMLLFSLETFKSVLVSFGRIPQVGDAFFSLSMGTLLKGYSIKCSAASKAR